ncbi:MAG: META domain-containing protein [Prevotellaceae bacterium]|jgi:heat shock protein HslJ|nr:META domain-containing protein [Prevotellaceae bacterium]
MLTSWEWKLNSLLIENMMTNIHDVKKNSTVKIDSDLQFFGSGGCNRFFGQAKIRSNNRIRMEVLGISQMICNDMNIETAYLDVLARVDSYAIDAGSLKLKQGNTVLAVFEVLQK